ncbi:MAG: hypothetical protein QXT01_05705 [Sulfolobales archaeon]
MLRPPRDHDIVEDLLGGILVVIGNTHPPNGLIAYLKYVRSSGKTLWRHGNTYYERVLKSYGVRNLHKYVSMLQEFTFDPVLNAYVPFIKSARIRNYYYPELRFQELLSRAEDELELAVLEFADMFRSYAGSVGSSLGVTGSLLTKTHNAKVSDADVVIYGCKCSKEFMESVENFTSLRPDYKALIRQSKTYGLPVEVLSKIYPPYKKLLVRGRVVNVIFVNDVQHLRYGSEVYITLHPVELLVEVLGNDCNSLFYPSTSHIYKVIDVLHPKNINLKRELITTIVSYEGLFSYQLYIGGSLRVRGLLQKVLPANEYRVLVGGIEEPGYVIPV